MEMPRGSSGRQDTYGLLSLDAVGLGGHLDALGGLLVDGRHFGAWQTVSMLHS